MMRPVPAGDDGQGCVQLRGDVAGNKEDSTGDATPTDKRGLQQAHEARHALAPMSAIKVLREQLTQ